MCRTKTDVDIEVYWRRSDKFLPESIANQWDEAARLAVSCK